MAFKFKKPKRKTGTGFRRKLHLDEQKDADVLLEITPSDEDKAQMALGLSRWYIVYVTFSTFSRDQFFVWKKVATVAPSSHAATIRASERYNLKLFDSYVKSKFPLVSHHILSKEREIKKLFFDANPYPTDTDVYYYEIGSGSKRKLVKAEIPSKRNRPK